MKEGELMKISAQKLPSISNSARPEYLHSHISKHDAGIRKSMKHIYSMMSLFANIPDMHARAGGPMLSAPALKSSQVGGDQGSLLEKSPSSFSIYSKEFALGSQYNQQDTAAILKQNMQNSNSLSKEP